MVWAYQPATMVSRCPVMYQTKLWCRSGFGGFQDRFIDAFLAPSKEHVLRGLELQHFNPLIRPNMSCFLFVSRFPRGRSNLSDKWEITLFAGSKCLIHGMCPANPVKRRMPKWAWNVNFLFNMFRTHSTLPSLWLSIAWVYTFINIHIRIPLPYLPYIT